MEDKRIINRGTYIDKMDTQNRILLSLVEAVQGSTNPLDVSTVPEFARMLGMGIGKNACKIGKQFLVPKEKSLTIGVTHAEGHTSNLSATVNEDKFLAFVGQAEEHYFEFTYNGGAWHDEEGRTAALENYGINITGTPAVGDMIVVHEAADNIAWDLVQYNPVGYTYPYDNSGKGDTAMLLVHKIQAIGTIPFAPATLLFYCKEAMPAGTYKVTLKNADFNQTTDLDGAYKFTITQPIPKFGGFRIEKLGENRSWTVDQFLSTCTVKTYSGKFEASATADFTPKGREIQKKMTVIEENIRLTQCGDSDAATNLGVFTAQSYATDGVVYEDYLGIRGLTRQTFYGDNRYSHSVAHKYLNATGGATENVANNMGSWFYYSYELECIPDDNVLKTAGYLHGYGQDFLDSIQTVDIPCAIPGYYSSTNTATSETVRGKMFLISKTEIDGGQATSGQAEGARLDYYNMFNTTKDKRKQWGDNYNWWWLRSASSWRADIAWGVHTSGGVGNYNYAYDTGGLVPACLIKKSA